MKLVMFDVDGTLTDTHATDATGFADTIRETLGVAEINTDWASYPHATSEAVLDDIARSNYGRPVTAEESRAVQLRLEAKLCGTRIMEIPGAGAFLRRLAGAGFAVALASGDWELTARYKLAAAGIPADDLPAAFCDSARERVAIMQLAEQRARAPGRRGGFDKVVYFGDGPWDVRACRELGWGFIGIESGGRPPRLRALGACDAFPDYRQGTAVLAAIATAAVPI